MAKHASGSQSTNSLKLLDPKKSEIPNLVQVFHYLHKLLKVSK